MMKEKRHPIYEIAEKLNWQVEIDFDDLESESKAFKAGLLFNSQTLMWDKEGNASETEALDSLLSKLQLIVCPEWYPEMAKENEEYDADIKRYFQKRKELEAEIAALKASVEYNRGEVNRLNNVIADKDLQIQELKQYDKKESTSYDDGFEYGKLTAEADHEILVNTIIETKNKEIKEKEIAAFKAGREVSDRRHPAMGDFFINGQPMKYSTPEDYIKEKKK